MRINAIAEFTYGSEAAKTRIRTGIPHDIARLFRYTSQAYTFKYDQFLLRRPEALLHLAGSYLDSFTTKITQNTLFCNSFSPWNFRFLILNNEILLVFSQDPVPEFCSRNQGYTNIKKHLEFSFFHRCFSPKISTFRPKKRKFLSFFLILPTKN